MVNLRYLISILKSTLYNATSSVIKKTMFLNKADIDFLQSNSCLLSIKQLSHFSNPSLQNSEEVSQKYYVELDLYNVMILCN